MPIFIVLAIILGGGAYLATRKKPVAAIAKAAPKPVVAAAKPAQKAPAVPYTRPILAGAATVAPHMPIPKVSKIAKAGKIVRLNQAAIIAPPVISAVMNVNPTTPAGAQAAATGAVVGATGAATGAVTGAVGSGVKGLTAGALAGLGGGTSGSGDDGSDTGDN